MKNRFTNLAKGFFDSRDWDPNSILGLGTWELHTPEYTPAVTNARTSRGTPHSSLPLAERLRKVQADLEAFEESLPDLNGGQS
jgi:hypothetical protein